MVDLQREKIGTFTMITPYYMHMSSAMVQQTFLTFYPSLSNYSVYLSTRTYLFIDISVSTENTFNLVCSIDKRSIQICSTETVAFSFWYYRILIININILKIQKIPSMASSVSYQHSRTTTVSTGL